MVPPSAEAPEPAREDVVADPGDDAVPSLQLAIPARTGDVALAAVALRGVLGDLRVEAGLASRIETAVVEAINNAVLFLARERELGTFDQLLVSPVSTPEIIISKSLPALAIAGWVAAAMLAYRLEDIYAAFKS